MTHKPTAILWFRQDLRLRDHLALHQLQQDGYAVLPVYIYDPEMIPGAASKWWLHHSLQALSDDLAEKGARLILRRGKAEEVLPRLAEEADAHALYAHRLLEPQARKQEETVANAMKDLSVHWAAPNLLHDPESVKTGSGDPYKVYTPFWKAASQQLRLREPLPRPSHLALPDGWPESDGLEDWDLTPSKPNWAKDFKGHWQPGEQGAEAKLDAFLDDAWQDYKSMRDYPAKVGTSRLSPHLHYGEITPQLIWEACNNLPDHHEASKRKYLAELGWREFCQHLLYHFPEMEEENFREQFNDFPWIKQEDKLKAWQQGQTGVPIVDAGMRELWQTGWMHNRVRMIVGSFLTKNLRTHWKHGKAWFEDTLVDADLCNNTAGWQWIAGSGADAAPYFRIFNPVTQAAKFDEEGDYIRRWVPELKKLPNEALFAPWEAKPLELREAGVTLGQDYPEPIVDLKTSRQKALDAYEQVKKSA